MPQPFQISWSDRVGPYYRNCAIEETGQSIYYIFYLEEGICLKEDRIDGI